MADRNGRTEKPTAKRRSEARKKGQVARSAEISSTAVLLGAVAALAIAGPGILWGLAGMLADGLRGAGTPTQATTGLGAETTWALAAVGRAVAPVAITCLLVGLIASDQHVQRIRAAGGDVEASLREMGKRVPLGRIGEAEEFANIACFLASDAGSYVTGTAINVDGGMSPVV